MRCLIAVLLTTCFATTASAFAHGPYHGYSRSNASGATTNAPPTVSVMTSTNSTTGVTTTSTTTTGAGTGQSAGGHNGSYLGRDALYDAEAQSVREQTQERYDDRYFNADRERETEVRRATNPNYTGSSAANRISPIHYGVVRNSEGESSGATARSRTDAFETSTDMDDP